ncbi:hypothetical protein [Streptomyces sp. L7]|uniref:hypothetical protein n=1 Tax=Streptomyces sp. L7 TaxID=3423954 RepID=UPI003D98FAB5
MTDPSAPDPRGPGLPASDPVRPRPPLLIALAVILTLEALLVTGLALWLLYELLTTTPYSYTTAIAFTILVMLGAAWLIVTLVGILRLNAWARASTVTIQILMIAVAVGSFEGLVGGGPTSVGRCSSPPSSPACWRSRPPWSGPPRAPSKPTRTPIAIQGHTNSVTAGTRRRLALLWPTS